MRPLYTASKGINFNNAFTVEAKSTILQNHKAIPEQGETENGQGKILYSNVFGPNTKVEYINTESGLKENIILDKYTGQNRFEFTFRSDTHIPILTDNGTNILVADKNNPEKVEYRFLSLYAYDSYDPAKDSEQQGSDFRHMNEDLHYELADNEDGTYTITVVVPEDYLTHPEIVYPVTIDPSVTRVSSNSNAQDTFIDAGSPNSYSNGNLDYIRFGKVNGHKNFGYHRFTSLPSLPSGAKITSAYLKFTFRSGQTTPAASSGIKFWTLQVTAHQWYESSLTWNNQPYGNSGPYTSFTYSGSRLDYVNANITSIVQSWYNGSPNYGIDFTYSNEDYNDYNSVVSSEGEASRAPVLTINYSGGGDVYRNMGWSYMFRTAPYSTPYYGMTQGYSSSHLAIDIAAPANTPVYSTTSGYVMSRGFNSSMGNYVVIKTNSKDSMGYLITRNMHFISAPPVALNQTVSKDTIIGYVGSTGDSTGNHLHFDVNNMGTWDGPTLRNNPSRTIDPTRFW